MIFELLIESSQTWFFYWSEVLNTSMFRFRILCYIVYLIRWKYSHVRLRQSCFLSSLQRLLEVITPTSNEWFTIKKYCQSCVEVQSSLNIPFYVISDELRYSVRELSEKQIALWRIYYYCCFYFLLQWMLWPWYLLILSPVLQSLKSLFSCRFFVTRSIIGLTILGLNYTGHSILQGQQLSCKSDF